MWIVCALPTQLSPRYQAEAAPQKGERSFHLVPRWLPHEISLEHLVAALAHHSWCPATYTAAGSHNHQTSFRWRAFLCPGLDTHSNYQEHFEQILVRPRICRSVKARSESRNQ